MAGQFAGAASWSAQSRPSSYKQRMAGASPELPIVTRAATDPKYHADTAGPEVEHSSHARGVVKLHRCAVVVGHLQ